MAETADRAETPDRATAPASAAAPAPRPRTRWAGIVWGLALAAAAVLGLWVVSAADRREAAADWLGTLSVPAVIAYALLSLGAVVLLTGLIAALRRAQSRRAP